jgi:thioredoxin-related protein
MKKKIMLISAVLLLSGIVAAQTTTPEPASTILEKAYKQAGKQKKDVMVIFHASWCGWCKKLEASINDSLCKAFFDRSYVICYLTILESKDKKNLENPGAIDIFNNNGGANGGIPFFLIYDKKGKLLSDSRMKGADSKLSNMGCPASEEEVAAFIEILKKTSGISDKEITAVTERFKKNKS